MTQFRALYLLILRSIATRGRVAALGALGSLGMLIGALIDAESSVRDATQFLSVFGLAVAVPLTTLVFASAALGDIIDDGTMVYLWLRPVPRVRIVGAAAAATLTVVLPLVLTPLVLTAVLTGGGTDLVIGTALSAFFGILAYTGLFVMIGVRVRRSLVWGLLYVFIWEGFVANAGQTASRLAVRAYTRSILSRIAIEPPTAPLRLSTISAFYSYVIPVLVFVVALAYATRRMQRQDVA
jgi:ABC-2 type transport system permease protein